MNVLAEDKARAVTHGRWLRRPPAGAEPLGVGIDTRADLERRVFVAIRGKNHDGHDHLVAAADAGAVYAIVDREIGPDDRPGPASANMGLLLVPDTRRALARLAQQHRRTLAGAKVIAITGTCGKTTTKRLVHAVLASMLPGTAAPRSFNNEIGVPLTLLAARPGDRFVVVEIGTNGPGEINALAGITEPDVAVITNVGRGHLAGLGTVADVAREKASLLAHLRPGGLAIVNGDQPELDDFTRVVRTIIRFGTSDRADLRVTVRGRTGDGAWVEVNGRTRFDLGLPGRHNAMNALVAIAIGRRLGLTDEQVSAALGIVEPEPMRFRPRPAGSVTVYDDAWNANPDSMHAALETFAELAADAPRRILVLGDMLELGTEGPALHAALGAELAALDATCPLDRVVLVGDLMAHAAAAIGDAPLAGRIERLPSMDADAIESVRTTLVPGDAVLVKASRGLALDRLVEAIVADPPADGTTESRAPRARPADQPKGAKSGGRPRRA